MKIFDLSCSNHFPIIILIIICLLVNISFAFSQSSEGTDTLKIERNVTEADTSTKSMLDTMDPSLMINEEDDPKGTFDPWTMKDDTSSFWRTYVTDPMRIGLKYEVAYKFTQPDQIRKNRISFGLEYSKSLSDLFFLKIDTRAFSFLKGDHRARSSELWLNDKVSNIDLSFGTLTRDVYLQTSFNKTSIKAGIQTLAWGESDFAIVTNEISPLDYREPLNLNVDELRFGQLMLTVDQFSSFGHWTAFFIPYPRLNQHPKEGTGYYNDPFNGSIAYQLRPGDKTPVEFGLRWKKTFGNSDFSVMAARLLNNEYGLQMVSPGLIEQSKRMFTMGGITFNHAISDFLIKGEAAVKFPKVFNDASLQIIEKNTVDASLGVDYSLNSSLTLSMEAVNNHVIDWDDRIQSMPRNNYMLLFILSKKLMNDDFLFNIVSMYNGPQTNFFNLITTSYNLNDHTVINLDMLLPFTNNVNSGLYIYRKEQQLAFKIQYQF